ncbi:MAG TPA: sialidase family protein [Roseiflexaceae bacterium]|nr:sialidase family protein [Roseiflexaceae bacterium]
MRTLARPGRPLLLGSTLALLAALLAAWLLAVWPGADAGQPTKGKRRSGQVEAAVIAAPQVQEVRAVPAPRTGFAPQTRLGFTEGDQWEPAIAAARTGHIYLLYPQYLGVPGCAECASPTMILQVSADRGATWGAPRPIHPAGSTTGQWDPQIAVDPIDGRTVYAAWLQNGKSDTVVAKSTDFGASWSVVVANSTNAGTDKPILAVRGQDVYVGYNHAQKVWVSFSHDGGATFRSVNVNKTGKLGWSLAGGGTVDAAGNVYFSWAGYTQNGGAKGPVYLYMSKSSDGGSTWRTTTIDVSGAPPDCSDYLCGWAYLGAQMTLASDAAGTLYALWNAGVEDKGPERIYFARSSDGGATWSAKADVSLAPQGVSHAFPAIAAASPGDVRISWMDTREGGVWNTYYRSSRDGGATWSAESDLSTYVEGFSYIQPDGFSFPFGDYYELDIDDQGITHAVWGEGLNYDSPGSIWYTRGR